MTFSSIVSLLQLQYCVTTSKFDLIFITQHTVLHKIMFGSLVLQFVLQPANWQTFFYFNVILNVNYEEKLFYKNINKTIKC